MYRRAARCYEVQMRGEASMMGMLTCVSKDVVSSIYHVVVSVSSGLPLI